MKIALASDHGGYELKNLIAVYLEDLGHEVVDYGTDSYESCDYPKFARRGAVVVANGDCERGILICTTGVGMSIAANKVPGIRCALCTDTTCARLAREHNDANMLALGAGIIGRNLALEIVDVFLATPFSHEARHERRLRAIALLEETYTGPYTDQP